MIREARGFCVAPRTRMLIPEHFRQRLTITDVMRHLVPLHNQFPELIPDGGHPYHLASLKVIQQAASNADIVTIRHQQGVQHRLCPVRYGLRAASLELQRYRQGLRAASAPTVLSGVGLDDDRLYCGVDVALQSVLRRPDVLLDVENLIDRNCGCSGTTVIRNSRFRLWQVNAVPSEGDADSHLVSTTQTISPTPASTAVWTAHERSPRASLRAGGRDSRYYLSGP